MQNELPGDFDSQNQRLEEQYSGDKETVPPGSSPIMVESTLTRNVREFSKLLGELQIGDLSDTDRQALNSLLDMIAVIKVTEVIRCT